MYTFKTDIDRLEYDEFVAHQNIVSIMQESAWGKVKNNWTNVLSGLYKDDVLVATALILIRKLAFNMTLIYVPRGYLIDYTNEELIKVFTAEIKKYAISKGAYCVKIDPLFCNNEISLKDKKIPLNFSNNWKLKHKTLINNGYIHKGFQKNMAAYLQPRFKMAVPLIDEFNQFLDEGALKSNISKTTRNYIGNYHERRGVYFTYSTNINDIEAFYGIINMTEIRQNIVLRNKEYYQRLMTSFDGSALLCFAHVDVDKYITFLNEERHNQKAILEDIERQLAQATEVKNNYGNDVITSVALVVFPSNTDGIKVMEYLYAGNDTRILPHLNTNVGLLFDIFKKGLERKMHYCNLGGIEGTFDDKLYTFKSKFNPVVLEFVGEYDLPIKNGLYHFYDKGLRATKRAFKVVRKIVKKVRS